MQTSSLLKSCKHRCTPFRAASSFHKYTKSQRQIAASATEKARVVFLGTPDVAALVLKELVLSSRKEDAGFEVVGVVSQPGKPKGRGNKSAPVPTPVEETARELGLQDLVMTPVKARDEEFLARLEGLNADLCVTAAYGNMLPQKFLDMPRLGTLNIHPSLLPRYRGAAPVQRCLQSGDAVGGVSVAYTVLKCDAGPVLAQKKVEVDPDIQAPEFLEAMFKEGVQLLLDNMPLVLSGSAMDKATPQDESQVTHADKLSKEDAMLNFAANTALTLHNAVRGFAGWPGTVGKFIVKEEDTGAEQVIELRIIKSKSPNTSDIDAYRSTVGAENLGRVVCFAHDGDMLVPCGSSATGPEWCGGVLRVTTVQPPTKKAMPAKDFKNGLRKKQLLVAM